MGFSCTTINENGGSDVFIEEESSVSVDRRVRGGSLSLTLCKRLEHQKVFQPSPKQEVSLP